MPQYDAAQAPGSPGTLARWTSSAKSGVGTSLGACGRIWFTVARGIVNEVYYPRVDEACTRDFGLIVTDREAFFSEEKRHAEHAIEAMDVGVPAFRLTNTCVERRYRIQKEVVSDPKREVLLQRVELTPLEGALEDYALFALIAPHLRNGGGGNTAWVGEYKGTPMLFAERSGTALALMCSAGWLRRSAGFVGASDGWQDLHAHRRLTRQYERADDGNVALTGEVDLAACGGRFVLALGFGRTYDEAAVRARASLLDGFDEAAAEYREGWERWQRSLRPIELPKPPVRDLYRVSRAVLRTHESALFPGGIIASLSIPWGSARGDGDLGGYHLVWPRDLVESAGGLLAAGARDDMSRVLRYLAVTQEADGRWPQNMWLAGKAYWDGIQMDETGFPILLLDLARREGALDASEVARFWPMVRAAAGFIVHNGPVTPQDRWEEDAGYSPFTLAVEVAALLCAADLAETHEPAIAEYLRETADAWNAGIERWTYVEGGDLARRVGVDGYYVRIASADRADAASPTDGYVPIKNRPPGEDCARAAHLVSPDALALVRFGVRAADDPRIVNTVKVIDALLRVDTPHGPLWHRYNDDGYGEHEDGSPFDGTGVGRAWPLLSAERAHYELAAGRVDEAKALEESIPAFAGDGSLLPEQCWDTDDVPERELVFGKPSGSAMPLVWAHAEYVKLCRSLADGRVFDTPPQPVERYQRQKVRCDRHFWRFNHKCQGIELDASLRVELPRPGVVHWSADGWTTVEDSETRDTGLGVHIVDLPTEKLPAGARVVFTVYWPGSDRWEGEDFSVAIRPAAGRGKG